MKKMLINVGFILCFVMLVGCNSSKINNEENSVSNIGNENVEEINNNLSDVEGKKLTSSTLSLFNPDVKESNYISIVAYDPYKAGSYGGDGHVVDNAILYVAEFDKDVYTNFFEDEYKTVASDSGFTYRHSLGTEDRVIPVVISTNSISSLSADVYNVTESKKYTCPEVKSKEILEGSIYGSDYNNPSWISGEGWIATPYDNIVKDIKILIAESDNEKFYLSVPLAESVKVDNSAVGKINEMVKNNKIKNSIYFLNTIDDFSSVEKYYGKEVELKKTLVYQDALATKISNDFGLNVRNKDYFKHLDNSYIKYSAYGSGSYLTDVSFSVKKKAIGYEQIYKLYSDNMYSYSIDNHEYEYIYSRETELIYVYKDKEFVGTIEVLYRGQKSNDAFKHLNELFGTK